MRKIEEFKLFLICHDLPLEPYYRLTSLCPQLLENYSFDEIIMTAPFLAADIKPVNKTIIISPIIYSAITLDAMRNESPIMAHISNVLALKGEDIIQKELLHLFQRARAKMRV